MRSAFTGIMSKSTSVDNWRILFTKINTRLPHILPNKTAGLRSREESKGGSHPRFHVYFTPTSSSWLNMVERPFVWTAKASDVLEKLAHRVIDYSSVDDREHRLDLLQILVGNFLRIEVIGAEDY